MPNKNEKVGNMRERITLQTVTETRSGSGHAAQSWATLATVWAEVKYRTLPSDEKEMADRKTAEQVVTFRIRYRTDVSEKNRILYGSEYYDIVNLAITLDKFYIELEGQKRN